MPRSSSLIIITARSEEARKLDTQRWIERYFPNVFDEIWFSGEFVALHQALTRTTDSKRPDNVPVMRCGKTKSEASVQFLRTQTHET